MDIKNQNGECVIATGSGNTIRYREIPYDKIRKYDYGLPAGKNLDAFNKATTVILNCSFMVNAQMADILESSKIIIVEEFSNSDNQHCIQLKPRSLFTFQKLQYCLIDMCQKMGL